MKVWLLNNIKFGHKNKDDIFNYFYNYYIPLLNKYSKQEDIIIHLGSIFNNQENINIEILNKSFDILKKISDILPIYLLENQNDKNIFNIISHLKLNLKLIQKTTKLNDDITLIPFNGSLESSKYIFSNKIINNNASNIYIGGQDELKIEKNIIYLCTPYQLNKNTNKNKGVFVIDINKDKHKFFENKFSPIYDTIIINNLEDISKLDKNFIKNNYIDAKININDTKQILKANIMLSEYDFKNINIIPIEINKEENNNISELKDIDNMLIDNIKKHNNENLLNDLMEILTIYEKNYK